MSARMTREEIFDALLELAAIRASHSGTFMESDLVDQDALFAVQAKLAALLADVANAIGPHAVRALAARWPHTFETTSTTP